ncbi:archaellar assembly protein FlaJ [Halococcoides cellulosivorans]|uniref:Flagellar assembly protein FlaJ n=1 Tax=Halococcoides cellulosivorans TaxID=1679096 RepID=A0A2R4X267_9EURY|nr:archaellar assembly protein FlaJ [Halococcoides cellulosivorans]AWB27878.1 flagellar assembly protein FlaJ [Halococcoides cellulosivorans]
MATQEATVDSSLSELFASLVDSYRRLPMPLGVYLTRYLVPAGVFFVVTLIAPFVLPLPLGIALPIPLLGLLIFGSVVFYPKILISQRRRALNNRFHLMVTHMTVLSTTNIDRMEVFRALSKEEEYGALAEELRRIVELVDTWNLSLDDACRRRAKEVPSDHLSDFFDRLSYTLGAGQSLEDYLVSEQDMMIENYKTVYRGTLGNLNVMQDLYLSMILSMTFALVFAIVLPILTGTNPTMTVAAVILMFILVQSGFYLAVRSIAPYDPVWFHPTSVEGPIQQRLDRAFKIGVGLSALLVLIAFGGTLGVTPGFEALLPWVDELPLPLYVAIPMTPMLYPGIVARQAEQKIKGRDDEFPSFIRALGATEGAKQSTTGAVLASLRNKDFGPLTENVDNLYRRLNMRLEPAKAWHHFAAGTGSYLIQKFSEMYLVGRKMGGSPKMLGELISANMNEILQLRQERTQETTTLIGMLYGITAASVFAFFIGLEIVTILSGMSLDLASSAEFDVNSLINASVYNIPLIEALLIVVIVFNAILSALMIRTLDGGHKMNTYMHIVALTWIGAITGVFTRWMVGQFLAI